MNEIRPRHGFEGIQNGGEIYGSDSLNSEQNRETEYLELVKLAVQTSMQNTPDAYEKSKEILKYASSKYSDVLDKEIEQPGYILGDGSEIGSILDGIVTDDEIERIFESSQNQAQQSSNSVRNTQQEPEQDFDEIYDSLIVRLTELKKSNNPNYGVELENTIQKIASLTDRIPNIRSQIESDIRHEMSMQQTQMEQQLPPNNSAVVTIDSNTEKEALIDGIISGMLNEGEFSNSGLDVVAKMNDIKYVKEKLKAKSIDELKLLLASYQKNNEEQMSNGGKSR